MAASTPHSTAAGAGPGAAQPDEALVPIPPLRKAVATVTLMAATILVVLDQTIATVALPHMQSTFGATPDTITWVLTSYIMASAVATPLAGWLTGRFGRTGLFGSCVVGFTISPTLCGLASTLPAMVAARLAQGVFGAFLLPMSQAFLYDMNRPSRQVRALTIWGVGSMAGPLIGPVLGGYLTGTVGWRWVFFINVPVGILAAIGIFATMPAFPAVRRAFDHVGFVMIAVALCALQLALDRGTMQDWFDSTEIIIEFGLSIAAFWMLGFHLLRARHPILSVSLFRNPVFAIVLLFSLTIFPTVLAGTALLPPMMQQLLGYPVSHAGWMMIPRGLALTAGLIIGGRLTRLIDGRIQVFAGLLMVAMSMLIQSHFNLEMDGELIVLAGAVQGFGSGVAMTVINFMVVDSAPSALRTEAAAIYALFRNTGNSMMIAIFSAILAHNIQVSHEEIGSVISSQTPAFAVAQLGGRFGVEHLAMMANAEVTRQAMMVAYVDDFRAMMWVCLGMLPLSFLLRAKAKWKRGG